MAGLQTMDTAIDGAIAPTLVPAKALKRRTTRAVAKPSKTKKTEAKAPASRPAKAKLHKWVANYIYADGDGKAAIAIKVISAANLDNARAIAEANAPGDEFVLSLHPQSPEQMLGHVRLQALAATQDPTPDFEPAD